MTSSLVLQDAHASRRLKVLNSTSASAIDRWEQCERQWFGGYIEGEWAPQSEAQARGTAIDLEVQKHYKGEPVAPGWAEAVRGIVKLLPPSPHIQHKIVVPTYAGGPVLVGFPDFLYELARAHVLVLDLKSLSDYRYAKTAEELRDNTQMVTYSAWLWSLPGVERVQAGHIAARFKRDHDYPVGYKFTGAKPSNLAEMERGRTLELWGSKLDLVRSMVLAAKGAAKFEDMAPTGAAKTDAYGKTSCESFGGCHFRGRCGFAVSMQVSKTFNNGATMSNANGPSLMEQLEAMKNAQNPLAQQMVAQPGNGGMVVGGGSPPGAFPAPQDTSMLGVRHPHASNNPNHAHPGLVLPASAGYAPGQPCNGRGFYAASNGQGFIQVEPGHMCTACVGPGVVSPSQALPPDAPIRTSTPDEIAAVVEGKKKGRPKKVAPVAATIDDLMKLQAAGFTNQEITAVQAQGILADALSGKVTPGMLRQPPPPAGYQQPSQLPAPAPVIAAPTANFALPGEISKFETAPVSTEEPKALAAAQASWYQQSGPPQPSVAIPTNTNPLAVAPPAQVQPAAPAPVSSPRPPAGLVLLIDCVPAKGSPAALLADWLGPVLEYACGQVLDDNGRSAPVVDLRLVPYARGKGYLAAAVRLALGTVPPVLSIDTSQYGADVVIEALTPWAPTIIVPGPGRR